MRASAITGRRALAGACLTALAVLAAACGSAAPSAAPTRTVTVTATASASGSPTTVTPSPSGPLPCATTDLKLTVGAPNGAAGTIFYPLDFSNTSGSACTMYGYPGSRSSAPLAAARSARPPTGASPLHRR
jgi:uncharacterized protein DUF4232